MSDTDRFEDADPWKPWSVVKIAQRMPRRGGGDGGVRGRRKVNLNRKMGDDEATVVERDSEKGEE